MSDSNEEGAARTGSGASQGYLDATPLAVDHMIESGWSYDTVSFVASCKLKGGGMLLRSPATTWLRLRAFHQHERCSLQHVTTVGEFNRLCDTFGLSR